MSKIFLLVDPDEEMQKSLETTLRANVTDLQVFFAKEGYEAMVKMTKAAPDILITDLELGKHYSGRKLLEETFKEKRLQYTNIIVTREAPDSEFCLDEVVSGRIQFVPRPFTFGSLEKAVAKALDRSKIQTSSEFRIRLIAAGETLFREGDKATCTYLLKSGKLSASRSIGEKSQILGTISPGEFVGEMAYINSEPRSADVIALENSELVEIPLEALDSLIFTKPAWSKALMKTLSSRLKTANVKND